MQIPHFVCLGARRSILAAAVGWLLASATHMLAADPLNVVLIMADDLNTDLGCYGHPRVRSPAIDRLAARGVRFERAYCQYPVCNPSRASLLSGRRPDTTRVVDNVTPPRRTMADAVFLPQYFRQRGYRTLKVGKIYHTGDEYEDPQSWDIDIRETRLAKNPPDGQILRQQGKGGVVLNAPDEETWDGFVARRGVKLLEEASRQNQPPFFLAVGFRRPHSPYIAPQRYFDLYPIESIPSLTEPAGHLARIPPLALTYKNGAAALLPAERAATAAAYYASLSFMDAQVGVVLDALDRLKLWDRTVVAFASDHGYHLGEHGGLWHKMTLFEESTRVPLVVAAPAGKRGASTAGLVELVDLYPTLCELCGLSQPSGLRQLTGLEGHSFAPLLLEPSKPWKRAAFTVVGRSGDSQATEGLDPDRLGRTMRTARWRYTEWPDGTRELYDHDQDPHEYVNLADAPAQAEVVRSLAKELSAGWHAALPATGQ